MDPQAKDGPPTLTNITLRCRVHNGHAAEADYGPELVARRIAEARQSRQRRGTRGLAPGMVPAPELFDALNRTTDLAAGRNAAPR